MVQLRPYHPEDALRLLALFRETVRRVNAHDYAPHQIAAWAAEDIDTDAWAARFLGRFAIVAEEAGRPVGFADLEASGHLDRFFVAADCQRRGIGRLLLTDLVTTAQQQGLRRIFTEASITARPFFASHGFAVVKQQVVICRGVEFLNFQMERTMEKQTR